MKDEKGGARRPRWMVYAFAAAVSVAVLLLREAIAPIFDHRPLLIALMPAIIVAALAGGGGPGLFAMIITAVGGYFLIFSGTGAQAAGVIDLLQLAMLVVSGLLVSVTSEALHRSRRRMARLLSERTASLLASESLFRNLFNESAEALLLYDGKVFLDCNASAMALLGRSDRSEIVGHSLLDLSPESQPDGSFSGLRAIEIMTAAQGGRLSAFEWEFLSADGPLVLAEVLLSRLSTTGRPLIAVSCRDITEQKRIDADLRRAKDAAEAATRAKSDFLANMSHEIRTPMNAIMGLSQLTLETELTVQQHDYVRKIKSSSTALLGIINDILDYSKIEADRLDIECINFYIEEVIREVANLFCPGLEGKGLELFTEIMPGVPLSLMGDPLRLGQVLNNLVGNAVKFTEAGEIHLRVELVSLSDTETVLRIAVRDTGVGLSKDQAERLFQPFIQADGSTTRRYGGTGLGLTISRRLVELMGGSIVVSSAEGQGSTFAFTAHFGIGPERRNLKARNDLRGMRVLVADDRETSLVILKELLESWQGRVSVVRGGGRVQQDIEEAEAAGQPFDFVILDWQMPDIDGVTLVRNLEGGAVAGLLRRPPTVIMVAGGEREQLLGEVGAVHIDAILCKPMTPSSLHNAIQRAIGAECGCRPGGASGHMRQQDQNPYDIALPIRGASILLVEDNDLNQIVAREFLQKAGLAVTIANNGAEGVEWMTKARFDVVLMDLQMPGMDGFEASRRIRQLPQGATIPIIAMTAAAMERDKQACAEAGMNGHISKPIIPRDLLEMLVAWVPARDAEVATPEVMLPVPVVTVPAPVAVVSVFPVIHGIETRQASMRMGGDAALFVSLLPRVIAQFADIVFATRNKLAVGDADAAARQLHTLRGAAGNLAAVEVAAGASEAEAAIRDGRPYAEVLARLEHSVDQLITDIRRYLSEVAVPAPTVAVEWDDAIVADLLRELESHNLKALDHFATAQAALVKRCGAEATSQLAAAMDGLNFAEALALLRAMVGGS
jgi:two-component system, sensor histidine kinase and response regulator